MVVSFVSVPPVIPPKSKPLISIVAVEPSLLLTVMVVSFVSVPPVIPPKSKPLISIVAVEPSLLLTVMVVSFVSVPPVIPPLLFVILPIKSANSCFEIRNTSPNFNVMTRCLSVKAKSVTWLSRSQPSSS